MNRVVKSIALGTLVGLVLTGCGGKATTGCSGPENGVTVCVNGKAVDFSAEKNGPHKHESGNIYAPVIPLAAALGIKVEADAGSKTVTIAGKKLEVASSEAVKGVHVHDGAVFVPVNEFAAAAGLKVEVNFDKGTAGFAK